MSAKRRAPNRAHARPVREGNWRKDAHRSGSSLCLRAIQLGFLLASAPRWKPGQPLAPGPDTRIGKEASLTPPSSRHRALRRFLRRGRDLLPGHARVMARGVKLRKEVVYLLKLLGINLV